MTLTCLREAASYLRETLRVGRRHRQVAMINMILSAFIIIICVIRVPILGYYTIPVPEYS